MKKILSILAAICISSLPIYAQDENYTEKNISRKYIKHLDLAVDLGTTGIGVELAAPVSNNVQVRTGFSFMPHFNFDMNFAIQAYDTDMGLLETKFDQLADMMHSITGYTAKDNIDMEGTPTYYNFKFLVDVFPFRDKRWHLTAGFYLGNSKIAKAKNAIEDMTSLLAVGIYNNMYDFVKDDGVNDPRYWNEPIYGTIYLDPEVGDQLWAKMKGYGRMGIHMGYHNSDGTPYMMEPNNDGTVSAKVTVNRFKPYIGFGFGDSMQSNKRYHVSFDCGVMFWGGTPKVITHDGTDIASDVHGLKWRVGDYVDIIKTFKVFPVINLRVSRRLF